ncbi:MAG: hypothetical protein HQ567_26645 [Candidatus Nealsonbacteria bacterium]|nr:hypothetical protein [Candidatus Nealsonbacteria bacterium]
MFVTCQIGAERAVKGELAREWPEFRPAFSRPGFLTFKLPENHHLYGDFDLRSVFARSYGFSLGTAQGDTVDTLARNAWEMVAGRSLQRIHVWQRDPGAPGESDDTASLIGNVEEARAAIRRHCPRADMLDADVDDPRQPVPCGEFVMDCILVDPERWCVGFHRAKAVPSQWPGGIMPLELPPQSVSRAWLKMEEALRWSEFPIAKGARWAEIGSAPGGSSQALLQRGMEVVGIDPAEMDAAVLAHPQFTHIRRRAIAVRRRQFRKIRWLAADMIVAPGCTLDAVEEIVTHREVNIRGLLLTLKLSDWKLADELPQYIARVRGWGYNVVSGRQLVHNRQEVCVAAQQQPFRRKPTSRRAGG